MDIKSLGRTLKRQGVTAKELCKTLAEKYNFKRSEETIYTSYYSKSCKSNNDNWDIVCKCLKEEYGIIYDNGNWREVSV